MTESENNKRKQNTLPEIFGIILPIFSAINDVVFGIPGLQFGKLNIIIFILSAIILLAIWIWLTVSFCKKGKEEEARYEDKKDKFIKRSNGKVDIEKIYSVIKDNDKKYAIKHKKEIMHYIVIAIMLGVTIILNCSMAVMQYGEMGETKETEEAVISNNASSNENMNTVENTIVNKVDGNHGITQEEKKKWRIKHLF